MVKAITSNKANMLILFVIDFKEKTGQLIKSTDLEKTIH